MDCTWEAERPLQNHRERTVTGAYEPDGLLNWIFFDEALQRDGRAYPVTRTTAPF